MYHVSMYHWYTELDSCQVSNRTLCKIQWNYFTFAKQLFSHFFLIASLSNCMEITTPSVTRHCLIRRYKQVHSLRTIGSWRLQHIVKRCSTQHNTHQTLSNVKIKDVTEPANIHIRRIIRMRISCSKSVKIRMRICCAIKITSYVSYCDSLVTKFRQFQTNW